MNQIVDDDSYRHAQAATFHPTRSSVATTANQAMVETTDRPISVDNDQIVAT